MGKCRECNCKLEKTYTWGGYSYCYSHYLLKVLLAGG